MLPTQPPLIRALLNPALHGPAVAECELIETHISWVILAGELVYKIKKPVDLGFLDFSTLERRRVCCEEELRINSRLAPKVYLAVVAIGGTPGAPILGGDGEPIEYAVKMARFPQEAQLDRMLARGELTPHHIDAFASLVAGFHQRIATAPADSPYGTPAAVHQPVAENFFQIHEYCDEPEVLSRLVPLERWSEVAFDRLSPLLAARHRDGFIRECHGDMHLRNLAWVLGEPIAFDGIEFNANLRWVDLISEVAFLVMDLQARAEPELAQRFLNGYLQHTGDYTALALLPFYLSYRAMVRAKVSAIRAGQPGVSAEERAASLGELHHYLALAEGYTRPAPPYLIITRGLSGSGKSTVTQPLLERLGAIRLRSDVERKRLHGMAALANGRAAPGEGIYTPAATAATYAKLQELAACVLDAGYPVIVDATFLQAAQREPFAQLAASRGISFTILDFIAPAEELRRRVIARSSDVSDADLAVLERQLAGYQSLTKAEQGMAIAVDTSQQVDTGRLRAMLMRRVK